MDRTQRTSEHTNGAASSSLQHLETSAAGSDQVEENRSGVFQGVEIERGEAIPHVRNAVGVQTQAPPHGGGMGRIAQVVQQPLNTIGALTGSVLRRVGRAIHLIPPPPAVIPEPIAEPVVLQGVEAQNVEPYFFDDASEERSELHSRLYYDIERGEDVRDSLSDSISLFERKVGRNNDDVVELRRHLAALNDTLERGRHFYNEMNGSTRSFESVGAGFQLNRELRAQINYAMNLHRRLTEFLRED